MILSVLYMAQLLIGVSKMRHGGQSFFLEKKSCAAEELVRENQKHTQPNRRKPHES